MSGLSARQPENRVRQTSIFDAVLFFDALPEPIFGTFSVSEDEGSQLVSSHKGDPHAPNRRLHPVARLWR